LKKKSTNIFIAQSVEELDYIYKKLKNTQNLICVPVNLSTHLYCAQNKIPYYNLKNFISNKFHKEALISSKRMTNKIRFNKNLKLSEKTEIKSFLRFYFNSIVFLIEIVEQIKKSTKINKIYVSGWFYYEDTYSKKNYYISFLLKELFKKKVIELSKNQSFSHLPSFQYKYDIISKKISNKKKIILFSNFGYNFFRILKYYLYQSNKFTLLAPIDLKLSYFKRAVFRIFKINFFSFKKIKKTHYKYKFKLPSIFFRFRNKYNLTKLLNFRIKQEKSNLIKKSNQFNSILKFLSKKNVSLIIANNSRGLDGQFLDYAHDKNIPSICVPHGTLSAYYNKFDRIYKNIISESVTYPKSTITSQSKISNMFFKKEKNLNNVISTGNIIFSQKSLLKNYNNKILYAVTSKDFHNIQYLGVEMYYEFLENLSLLNNMAKTNRLDITVKCHPSIESSSQKLSKNYSNLHFTSKSIQKALNETNLTISFSSTVIEDSLYSHSPVILFDRWKRYQHCHAELNTKLKNRSVYYINSEKNLLKCIKTIFNSKNINFNSHIIPGKYNNNIKKLFKII